MLSVLKGLAISSALLSPADPSGELIKHTQELSEMTVNLNERDGNQYRKYGKLKETVYHLVKETEAKPDKIGKDGTSALHLLAGTKVCTERGHAYDIWQLWKEFLEKSQDLNVKDSLGQAPLHVAARGLSVAGDGSFLEKLIKRGADIQSIDNEGRTPLFEAVTYRFTQGVRLLLEAGASPDRPNNFNTFPLHVAAQIGFLDGLTLLLEKGAKTSVTNHEGKTPVQTAEESTKNRGAKWRAVGTMRDWQDTHPGQ